MNTVHRFMQNKRWCINIWGSTYCHWRAKFLKYMNIRFWVLSSTLKYTGFLSRSILEWGWEKGKAFFLKRSLEHTIENKHIYWITRLHPELKITRTLHHSRNIFVNLWILETPVQQFHFSILFSSVWSLAKLSYNFLLVYPYSKS